MSRSDAIRPYVSERCLNGDTIYGYDPTLPESQTPIKVEENYVPVILLPGKGSRLLYLIQGPVAGLPNIALGRADELGNFWHTSSTPDPALEILMAVECDPELIHYVRGRPVAIATVEQSTRGFKELWACNQHLTLEGHALFSPYDRKRAEELDRLYNHWKQCIENQDPELMLAYSLSGGSILGEPIENHPLMPNPLDLAAMCSSAYLHIPRSVVVVGEGGRDSEKEIMLRLRQRYAQAQESQRVLGNVYHGAYVTQSFAQGQTERLIQLNGPTAHLLEPLNKTIQTANRVGRQPAYNNLVGKLNRITGLSLQQYLSLRYTFERLFG
ncbi:hypothetical protein JW930_05275 [Candidatus Woesearchaeota archaeon]|nr:hypothetical protein [Candidatus Woesearchaeota archaeon]